MNTETEIPAAPANGHAPNIQSVDFSSEAKRNYRKIAKLPKPLRALINSSIDDSLPAKEIIQKLQASTDAPLPYPITEVDISRWKSTGYQSYLAHQDHLDSIEAAREAALEMVRTSNNLSLPQATLQVIASQCFEVLADFSPVAIKQKLAEDPLKYTSFLHVFARLTREIVHLEKFHEARLAEAKKLDPNRDLSESETLLWGGQLDRAFHRKDPRRIKTEIANNPEGIAPSSPGLRERQVQLGPSYPGIEAAHAHNPERVASSACEPSHEDSTSPTSQPSAESDSPPIQNPKSKIQNLEEHCLDCHHPLPPLTPEGTRPHDRCQICNILLPPPGTCTRPSADKCHHCGATLPRRLPNGRRPTYVCHNCGAGLGRELDEDLQRFRDPNQPSM